MSKAARSILVFGTYLTISGALLIVVPNTLFTLVGIPNTTEVWARIVGVLTLILGFYFIQAARQNVTEFFRWTLFARVTFMIFITTFVLLGLVSPVLILFGAVDLVGAIWTALALRHPQSA